MDCNHYANNNGAESQELRKDGSVGEWNTFQRISCSYIERNKPGLLQCLWGIPGKLMEGESNSQCARLTNVTQSAPQAALGLVFHELHLSSRYANPCVRKVNEKEMEATAQLHCQTPLDLQNPEPITPRHPRERDSSPSIITDSLGYHVPVKSCTGKVENIADGSLRVILRQSMMKVSARGEGNGIDWKLAVKETRQDDEAIASGSVESMLKGRQNQC